jgi:hypothetical protein
MVPDVVDGRRDDVGEHYVPRDPSVEHADIYV